MSLSKPVSREKMLPWLKKCIDSNRVPGLYWVNDTDFRVPWKHAGKPDFILEKDAVLFRMWAEHTGKYKPGEQPDPSTWKTRFRCALRKQPNISEVHKQNSLDDKEPYRVFRIHDRDSRSSSTAQVSSSRTPSPTNDVMEGPFSCPNADHECHISRFDNTSCSTLPSNDTSCGSSYSDDDDLDNIIPTIQFFDDVQNMLTDPQRLENFGFDSHVTHDANDDMFSLTSQQYENMSSQMNLQDQNDSTSQLEYLNALLGPAAVDALFQTLQCPTDYFPAMSEFYQEMQNTNMQQELYMGVYTS